MRTPARAQLGRRYAGQAIGYHITTLDGALYAPFTRAGVREAQPGHYVAAVDAPPAGGWIVWGTAGNPAIAEAELPAQPPALDLTPIREALAYLESQFAEALRTLPAPVVTVDTAAFDGTVAGLRADLRTLAEAEQQQRAAALATVGEGVAELRERVRTGEGLSEAIDRFNAATALAGRLIAASGGITDLAVIVERLDRLREEMATEHAQTLRERQTIAGHRQAFATLDQFLAQLEAA
jgi:hypothetical protein